MKLNKILSFAAAITLSLQFTACDGEKDLIIIEGNLPIKTSALYMVGDATPAGWNIDNPVAMTPTEADPLVFTWEGLLYAGELKLCLTTGSWDAGFIRPENNGDVIGSANITDATFVMWAGDPDNKWRVAETGTYSLTFDLRNWTMSTSWLGAPEAPAVEPIEAENVYIVGDASPNGWNIDTPLACEKKSQYIFVYEGELTPGELKACTTTGSFDVDFIRPSSADCTIGKSGVSADDFVYSTAPDNKWRVTDRGIYRLTFDLEHWTVKAEYLEEIITTKEPIETGLLIMIGDAVSSGWSMDDAPAYTVDPSDKYIFTWEGDLLEGDMKACLERDGTFSCPFLRPAQNGCEIGESGVAVPEFEMWAGDPDNKWHIAKAGRYRITFNLQKWTIEASYLN